MNKTIEEASSTSSLSVNGPELGFHINKLKSKEKFKKPKFNSDTSLPFISAFNDGIKNIKIN